MQPKMQGVLLNLGGKMSDIKEVIECYERFVKESKTPSGGFYLYPRFDHDLNVILDFVKERIYKNRLF